MRTLNDSEFLRFAAVGRQTAWKRTIDAIMHQSPYGAFGFDGAPYSYSSRSLDPRYTDSEFQPDDREFWNAPNRCDWTAPIFLHIALEALPDYQWAMYRHYEQTDKPGYEGEYFGHTEVVGTDPETGEVVALGLNVSDAETSITKAGYPHSPITRDVDVMRIKHIAETQLKSELQEVA